MFLFTNRASSASQPSVSDTLPHAAPLRQASKATGVSFDYLAKTAERESRFNPNAKATTSSATGMFQFLEQTWLGMVKQEGAKVGLTSESAAIANDGGRFSVSDPSARQRILALREDPGVSAMMAGAFAAKNGQQLQESLGRKPSEGELYIAHFMGASGARDLITLAKNNPDAPAASSFRDAASSNRSVFFDKNGRARSAGEVYGNLTGVYSQNPITAPQQTAATTDKAFQMFRVKGEGKPMHGLFRSSGEPVAEAVANTWNGIGRNSAAAGASETRVAFFPTEGRALQPKALQSVSRLTRSDVNAAFSVVESGRKAVTMALPPQRPVQNEAVQPRRIAPTVRAGQPLDLLRFVKASSNP
jgi:Transglycosylase SLT domain